ncbi:unannotated protein [freshwater metagenome]|uniref:Unannotated protein n=1 Tax=freshwater metagenome TaxID=449393 RepID=A0A6J6NCQ7_9ZZZZ
MLVPVPGSDRPRVSLVPDGALLLAGDRVRIEVRVEDGAALDLVEPGGTVAYDMRGGRARWEVDIDLGDEASLTWAGQPLIVAAGADVVRATTVQLGSGARLALRETVVLGRHGEAPSGRIELTTRADTSSGHALLVDAWSVAGADDLLLSVGGARVLGSVLVLGADLPADATTTPAARLDLEAGGTLVRTAADEAHLAQDERTWQLAVHATR